MKNFYKLSPLELGTGNIVPEGYIEYIVGQEPQELLENIDMFEIIVPTTITPRQARLALLKRNLLDAVDAFLQTNPEHKIEWEYATYFERNSNLIISAGAGLGLTSEQIDELFIYANTF